MDVETRRDDIESWLILLRAPALGPAALRELLAQQPEPTCALSAACRGQFERANDPACRAWLRAPDADRIADDLTWLAHPDHSLLTFDNPDYPSLLRESSSAPAALFVAGDANLLWRPQIAIVGSRNASQGGIATARDFARTLSTAGFAITSGLAEGIDGAAHAAALDAGGATIAVLGTGPDLVYPQKHHDLAARIATDGVVVSEFPPGTPAQPHNFPRRNRIIAGFTLGTLVVEAGLRSGSLITARIAAECGREVFAIPGSIHNPLARGCHQLIRNGAKLVETAEEIISELAPLARGLGESLRDRLESSEGMIGSPDQGMKKDSGQPSIPRRAADPDYAKLFAALGHDTVGIDQLSERSGLPTAALSSMLLMLELEGELVATRGGAYALRVGGAEGKSQDGAV